jgi:hypothetical protein
MRLLCGERAVGDYCHSPQQKTCKAKGALQGKEMVSEELAEATGSYTAEIC